MSLIRYSDAEIPTVHGPFRLYVYRDENGSQPGQAAGFGPNPARRTSFPARSS